MSRSAHFRPEPPPRPRPELTGAVVGVECAGGNLIDATDLRRIEELDDAIFDALDGDADALDRSSRLWRQLRRDVAQSPWGESLLDESREQYIRQAEAVVTRYRESPHDALGSAFAAIEVLALVAD